jgi:hypothetical protein
VGATDDVNSLSCVMRDPESKIAEVIPGVRGPDGKAHIGFEGDDRSCRENPSGSRTYWARIVYRLTVRAERPA